VRRAGITEEGTRIAAISATICGTTTDEGETPKRRTVATPLRTKLPGRRESRRKLPIRMKRLGSVRIIGTKHTMARKRGYFRGHVISV